MKIVSLKKAALTVSLMLSAVYAGNASAHSQSGTLGNTTTGAARTDVYIVTCFNDGSGAPAKLALRVKDNAPVYTPKVGIMASKGGASTALSQDPVDGDSAYSSFVTLSQGAGDYTMSVTKTSSTQKVPETYTAEFHCQTSNGTHTGTNWYQTQNQ